MTTIVLNRGEPIPVPFSIADNVNNGLLGKRVTWSVAEAAGGNRILHKQSALPGSSTDISIATQTASLITGTINLTAADLALLASRDTYAATLWLDDGGSYLRCATAGGADTLSMVDTVSQAP